MTNPEAVHAESEAHAWGINVPNHPTRADSPEYVAARSKMNEIAGQAAGMIYGQGPFEDHHGGALWLKDGQGWFLVRNQAGIEWSAQFSLGYPHVAVLAPSFLYWLSRSHLVSFFINS